jgi:hypothetical protein
MSREWLGTRLPGELLRRLEVFPLPIGNVAVKNLESLISEPAAVVSPKAFAALNVSLKAEKKGAGKKGNHTTKKAGKKPTKKAAGKTTKTGRDGDETATFKVYLERMHPRARHSVSKTATDNGKPDVTAKNLAGVAGRTEMKEVLVTFKVPSKALEKAL